MKTRAQQPINSWLAVLALCLPLHMAYAELSIPGISGVAGVAGSDGDLTISADATLDLSLAKTGAWDSASSGNGVYDPSKWAVVYKFNSVTISAGKTLKFKNHPSGAPVVWLVTGNVNIAGTLNLIGEHGGDIRLRPSFPGPGGFAGGTGRDVTGVIAGGGFGPGGAMGNFQDYGSYSTIGYGDLAGVTYGNERILPLIGGSGGGGRSDAGHSGGAGGGAILIVAADTLNLTGTISAMGGSNQHNSGGGSGGAVRVIADTISGSGTINAGPWTSAGQGRVRLETNHFNGNVVALPTVPINSPDEPLLLWPPAAAPSIRVVSIGAINAPIDPTGSPQTGEIDFQMDNETSSNIVLEAKNVQSDASVTVRIVPVFGLPTKETASFSNGTTALSTWTVNNVNLPLGAFVVQAHAVNP